MSEHDDEGRDDRAPPPPLPAAEELVFGAGPAARVLVVRHASLASGALSGAAGGAGDATGLMLWPGARALCRAALSAPCIAGSLVIELGCGAGVCSAAAGRAAPPPLAVLATDGDARALPLAAATWAANASARCGGGGASPPWAARAFRWGEDWEGAAAALLREAAALLPRSGGGGGGGAPAPPVTLLASECIYPSTPREAMRHFFCAARRLLGAHARSCLLMSYVPRDPATSLALLAAADAAGFAWEVWRGEGDAAALALGCQASLGEESGAVVLRLEACAGGAGAGALAERVRAVFPDAAAAVARRLALQQEAEEMAQSGDWGAPPL